MILKTALRLNSGAGGWSKLSWNVEALVHLKMECGDRICNARLGGGVVIGSEREVG